MAEQFSEPRPNLIVSTAGYEIEVLGRVGMRYAEGGRSMFIDSEVQADPGGMTLFRQTVRTWDPPHGHEPVTESDQSRIIANIRRAFAARGYRLDVL